MKSSEDEKTIDEGAFSSLQTAWPEVHSKSLPVCISLTLWPQQTFGLPTDTMMIDALTSKWQTWKALLRKTKNMPCQRYFKLPSFGLERETIQTVLGGEGIGVSIHNHGKMSAY